MQTSITTFKGAVDMAKVDPWYKGVKPLSNPTDIPLSLRESGLTWEYALTPLYDDLNRLVTRRQKLITVDVAGVRSDAVDVKYPDWESRARWNNDHPEICQKALVKTYAADNFLTTVGKDYQLHQPEFIYDVFKRVAERMNVRLTMAGDVNNGQTIFARARLSHDIEIKDALIKRYLMLMSGVDKKTRAGCDNEDHGCMNAWRTMLKGATYYIGLRHTAKFDLERFVAPLLQDASFDRQRHTRELSALINAKITKRDTELYFREVLFPKGKGGSGSWITLPGIEKEKRNHVREANQKLINQYLVLANSDATTYQDARYNTWYGAFQAAIWIVDRQRSNARLSSHLAGTIGNRKVYCYQQALNSDAVKLEMAA